MPRELKAAKVARLFADDRIRMNRADTNPRRLSLLVLGDSADPFAPLPYSVVIERYPTGALLESCDCDCPKRICSHLEAARIVSRILGIPKGEAT